MDVQKSVETKTDTRNPVFPGLGEVWWILFLDTVWWTQSFMGLVTFGGQPQLVVVKSANENFQTVSVDMGIDLSAT